MIEFRLDCEPPTATHQQKGVRLVIPKEKQGAAMVLMRGPSANLWKILKMAIPMHFEKENVKQARDLFRRLLLEHIPKKPLEGALIVEVTWIFPWRKSESKKVTSVHQQIPKDTQPDAGNLNKLFIDVMTDLGFWPDDAVIFDERARKFWGEKPGIEVRINPYVASTGLLFEDETESLRARNQHLAAELTKALDKIGKLSADL